MKKLHVVILLCSLICANPLVFAANLSKMTFEEKKEYVSDLVFKEKHKKASKLLAQWSELNPEDAQEIARLSELNLHILNISDEEKEFLVMSLSEDAQHEPESRPQDMYEISQQINSIMEDE